MSIPDRKNGQTILATWFNSLRSAILEITVNYILANADFSSWGSYNTIIVDASTGTVDVTMPNPADNINKVFTVIAKDVTNTITVLPYASETILGESSYVLRMNYETIKLINDGVNWYAY